MCLPTVPVPPVQLPVQPMMYTVGRLDDPMAPPVMGVTGGPAADGADAAPTEGEVSHG